MKFIKIKLQIFILIIFQTNLFFPQIKSFGLEGKIVNDLKTYSGKLYAATDSGVYQRNIWTQDSTWTLLGLIDKNVTAIYPHISGGGPGLLVITAGITPKFAAGDSALIYCSCEASEDNIWTVADSGINRDTVRFINTLDGFPSPAICGETFAGGTGKLYRRGFNETWYEKSFDIGVGHLNVVKTDSRNGNTWIGGENAILSPFISKSTDQGLTWMSSFPMLGGDNACNSIEFDAADTNIIYAGMEGLVIKSTDNGYTWDQTDLNGTPYYFYGLAGDHNILYAGGSTNSNELGLYWSTDKGNTWDTLPMLDSIPFKGIISMVLADLGMRIYKTRLYLGTNGDGVLSFDSPIVNVDAGANIINEFSLSQNYPNPFNPSTNFEFRIADFGFVTLKVYDILGNEVTTLVNQKKSPGKYNVKFNASGLSSGIYFYQLKMGSFMQTKKMILMR
ncbi:MAG: T9SS type A sorting domain-containing protein [Ignavibacteria bacterium]